MSALSPISSISSKVGSTSSTNSTAARMLAESRDGGAKGDVKTSFQDFAGGTFYKEMLKALQKTHGKAAYFSGGQAEKMFQSQMDQQVAEDMAHTHGKAMTDSLYQSFMQNGRA